MIQEMSGDFLQWLRGFYYVATGKSFSKAALEMGRNQPTISHHVKSLEREFGIVLFDRSGGKIDLTSEGRFFLRKAITIFEQIKEITEYANKSALKIEGHIRIASTNAIISFVLPRYISAFLRKYPKVTFHLEGGGLDEILRNIESAEADFAILNKSLVPKNLQYSDLFEAKPVLIASKDSHFITDKSPTLQQIAQLPVVLGPKTGITTHLIKKRFSSANLKLNTVVVTNNLQSLINLVGLGIGVAILDDYMLTQEDKKKLNIFPLKEFFEPRPHGVVLRKRMYLSPTTKAFVKALRSGFKSMDQSHCMMS